MATTQLPGQDIPIQLPDRQIEPVWYGWFRHVGTSVKSLLVDVATNTANIATNTTNIATNTASIAAHEAAWTAYTPTVIGSGGAVGTAAGRYKPIGKTVFINLDVTVGTGGSALSISLPPGITAKSSFSFLEGGEVALAGHTWHGLVTSAVTPVRADVITTAVTAGWRIILSGVFEAA